MQMQNAMQMQIQNAKCNANADCNVNAKCNTKKQRGKRLSQSCIDPAIVCPQKNSTLENQPPIFLHNALIYAKKNSYIHGTHKEG